MSDARPACSLAVVTPWYPSMTEPWSGTFVAGLTTALSDTAPVGVTHVTVVGRAARARVATVQHAGPVTRVELLAPPGGWGLRGVVRAARPHVPRGIPLIAHAPIPAGLLAAHGPDPFAVVLHGRDVFGRRQRRGARPVARETRDVLERAAAIIAVSDRVRCSLPPQFAGRTEVIYNGVDLSTFNDRDRSRDVGPPRLLSVGNISPGKGHGLVLEALPRLVERHPGLHWDIVGVGPLRGPLELQAHRLGLGSSVSFLGPLPPAEVAVRMRSATVFVLPATYEALGCVFLEAMACGVPVVAARDEGIEELVRDGVDAVLVDPTVQALATAVDKLLASPGLAADIGAEAARRAIDFDWRLRAREVWALVGAVT